jgi:hypothetical protein
MLKQPASFVLASFRPSTLNRSFSEVGNTGGVFPIAKIHVKGEQSTRSAVCTSSAIHSLGPCPRNGASQGEEPVLADSGREGEITAGVGRVRRLACLSILRKRLLVFQTCHNSFPRPTNVLAASVPDRLGLSR